MKDAHQRRDPVDHRRVDNLAAAAALGLEQRAHHAIGQVKAAPGEIPQQGQGGNRRAARRPDAAGGSGNGFVVKGVARHPGQRPGLAPAREASVDQAGVAGVENIRAQPQALGHSGAKGFEKSVRALGQAQHCLDGSGILEVERNAPPPPIPGIMRPSLGILGNFG